MKIFLRVFARLLPVLVFCAFTADVFAQGNQVSGVVTDSSGAPLIGAAVTVDGTMRGTSTGSEGEFSIAASPGDKIRVSYIGYMDNTIGIGQATSYTIVMEDAASEIEDIVVVGYGTQRKVNLTGAVASITSDQFDKRPIVSTSSALQGLVPGVTVTTQTGAPGGDGGTIRIRGIGTYGGSKAGPLVLIDGVEGNMDYIDPSLIESMSVLKDAASASIYGSRAANGVILVTTKRAGKDKFSVTYKGYVGFQMPTNRVETVGVLDYLNMTKLAYENDNNTSPYSQAFIDNYATRLAAGDDPDTYPDTNWADLVLTEKGFSHNHTLTLSASTDRIKSISTLGFSDQGGLIKNTDFQRYTLRNNMDVKFNDKLSMRFDLQIQNMDRLAVPGQSTIFNYIYRTPPNLVAEYSTGLWGEGWNGNNPVAIIAERGNRKTNRVNLSGTVALVFHPLEWLTLEGIAAPKYNTSHVHLFQKPVQTYVSADGAKSAYLEPAYNSLQEDATRTFFQNYQFLARTSNSWNGHNLKGLLGASQETYDHKTLMAYRQNYIFPDYEVIRAGADDETKDNDGIHNKWKLNSFFARVNYDYRSKYLFEANLRYDGSSRFLGDNQWGLFPSFSAGWRVTEEAFMRGARKYVQELKLRASWGQLGNQEISSKMTPGIGELATGSISMDGKIWPLVTQNDLPNPLLMWEITTMLNVGLDLTFLSDFSLTFDAYRKISDGILMSRKIPNYTGYTSIWDNGSVVRNIGWELGLSYRKRFGDFDLGVNFNLADVHNKILKGNATQSGLLQNREGYAINSIFGLKADGYFQNQDQINDSNPQFGQILKPGDIRYVETSGDDRITADDQVIIGSTIPRWTYGFNLNLGWKGLRFNMFLQGVGKVDGLLNSHYIVPGEMGGTYKKIHKDYWTESNPNAAFPRLSINNTNNTQNSTHYMRSAAYLRLKNLQLGYSLPQRWMDAIGIKSVYVYVNADNLLTFTNWWDGYDPEIQYDAAADANAGVSLGNANYYPQVKTFTMGVEIKF